MRVWLAALLALGCTDDPECADTRLVDPGSLACIATCGGATWAACETACTDLGETDCAATPGCRAAHDHDCWRGANCLLEASFLGCYAVDTTGPVQGPCDDLAAEECSRHDDCIALHTGIEFRACVSE